MGKSGVAFGGGNLGLCVCDCKGQFGLYWRGVDDGVPFYDCGGCAGGDLLRKVAAAYAAGVGARGDFGRVSVWGVSVPDDWVRLYDGGKERVFDHGVCDAHSAVFVGADQKAARMVCVCVRGYVAYGNRVACAGNG